ncbi:MAG: hypothetical protein JWN80_1947 [Microbacteriaceae bacterium]|jgi:uncharacterized OB-fold protein|nr:hypothetical protein [Microbacteriaceae bacterium]
MTDLRPVGEYIGPAPVVHPDNENYWKALGRGTLQLQRCSSCGTVRFPVAPVCYHCGSQDDDWVDVAAGGSVSAAIRVERATGDSVWASQVPFIAGQVDTSSGIRLPGRIFCECGGALEHGATVEGGYLAAPGDYGVLCFVHGCVK